MSGRLENRPIAAAPNAWTTSRVSTVASRFRVGASKIPPATAKLEPMIQAHRRTAAGLVPPRSSSSGLSTTPRMARPSRVSRKNRNRATVAASAMPVMIIWSSPTNTPPILTVCCGSQAGKVRASVPNVAEKKPWTTRTRPIVATTCMVADASASRRAIASMPRPSTGPSTNTQISAVGTAGRCRTSSCRM